MWGATAAGMSRVSINKVYPTAGFSAEVIHRQCHDHSPLQQVGMRLRASPQNHGQSPAGSKLEPMTLEFSQLGLAPDFVDYMQGWDLQREIHNKVVAGEKNST